MRAVLLCVLCAFVVSCRTAAEGPPYAAEDALETFHLPDGFRIELVAAEPYVQDPVAMAFDENGRLFVVEMPDYPMEAEPRGRIKLLEDLNGDGRMDKSAVFAEGLHFPTSVLPWKNGVLVTAAPDLLYLSDNDGDDRADKKQVILTGFNQYNPQLRANGLLYSIDNWIYGAYPKVGPSVRNPKLFAREGGPIHFPGHPRVPPVDLAQLGTDFRFHPDLLKLQPASGNSQFGNTFDAFSNRFTVWNNNHIRHVVIAHHYLQRNPHQDVPSAMHFASDHESQSILYPRTKDPVFIHESQVGMLTSACGNTVYTGAQFPAAYERAYFVCDPVHNLVHADRLEENGATFVARRTIEKSEFLTSTDSWFKPVFTTVGPDGGLYVVDYYRKYVEHPDYLPEHMTVEINLREGEGKGRIYRILHDTSQEGRRPQLKSAGPEALVRELSNPNMWWRITAQRLLVLRKDDSIVPLLRSLVTRGASAEARIHALWTLQGLEKLDSKLLSQALRDGHAAVREHAIRVSEQSLSSPVLQDLLSMAKDPSTRVRFQLACSLASVGSPEAFQVLKGIAFRQLDDQWFQIAVLSSASDNAGQWLEAVTADKHFLQKETKAGAEFVARIASIIGAGRKEQQITGVLASLARSDRSPAWWHVASLRGLAEGLKRGKTEETSLSSSAQRSLVALLRADSPGFAGAAVEVASQTKLSESL